MRRSTKKAEQADSLPQQEEGIEYIAKEMGIEFSKIILFTESRSGFENRTRKEWNKMLLAIDQSKEPCSILCRDTSRLSRNPTDNLEIANRIFWDNKYKKTIGSIFFLWEQFDVNEWNDKTDKKTIVDTLHDNYTNSIETKKKSMAGILLKLMAGEFPYTPPHWLSRVTKAWLKRVRKDDKTVLKENEKMPFIRRAFEMKVEGKTAKEISSYLKKYWRISSVQPKKITETIIQNTVYKWEYTEKTTNRLFKNLLFWEWKPPISPDLWSRANDTIWKRWSWYWLGQEDHIALGKIKAENGNDFYLYLAKKKYRAYSVSIKNANGKIEKIHIMERIILERFINEIIPKIIERFSYLYRNQKMKILFGQDMNFEKYKTLFGLESRYRYILKTNSLATKEELLRVYNKDYKNFLDDGEVITDKNIKNISIRIAKKQFQDLIQDKNENPTQNIVDKLAIGNVDKESKDGAFYELKNSLQESPFFDSMKMDMKVAKKQIANLKEKKWQLEKDISDYRRKAVLADYTPQEIKNTTELMMGQVNAIQKEIDDFENDMQIEKYLDYLPEILLKTSELAGNTIKKAESEDIREDLKKLLAITTSELLITNKKELRIQLFWVLERILNSDNGTMEPPMGHEPMTFPLPWGCSTNWAKAAYLWYELAHYIIYEKNSSFCEFYKVFLFQKESIWYEFLNLHLIKSYNWVAYIKTSRSSQSEHKVLECNLIRSEQLFSYLLSLIVPWKWFTIAPPHATNITSSWESESSSIWMIPVWLIMSRLISRLRKVREFIMIPTNTLKILYNL